MKTQSKARLFLIELVIIILFFAFAGAVCASIFVEAHLTSERSADISAAAIKAQLAAECVKETKGGVKELQALLGGQPGESGFIVYYDGDWNAADQDEMRYCLRVDMTQKEGLLYADISVFKGDETLYAIQTGEYLENE